MASASRNAGLLRIVLIVVAIVVLAPLLFMGGGGMMGGGMMGGGGGSGILGAVFQLVLLVVLVGGGYLVYRQYAGSESVGSEPALEALRLAYARGEISNEEFEERRAVLQSE